MNQRFLLLVCCLLFGCHSPRDRSPARAVARQPNVVLIFCDDLGYADIGPYGSRTPTPNLDLLARDGMRFTDFYVPQAVCSASRAALLTGCYPNRVGIQGALPPRSKVGLNPAEITIAELLKDQGYATAIFGKWHLGDAPQFLPTRQGFDEWFGLPYSNDMWPHHPTSTNYPPLPLYENERVLELMPDQAKLTTWYTERAVSFIDRHKSNPFFLYVPHSMPHVPLFVSEKSKGKSGRGLYADVIMEIDWSVGEILKAIKRNGLDENTLVIFTSDNGPWLLYGNHAGSAGPLREGKGTSFDGGVRVPFIARWTGTIPRGVTHKDYASTMDLFPTIARLAGTHPPSDRVIDGRDMSPVLLGKSVDPRADPLFIYWGRGLQALRHGSWKLHFPHDYTTPQPGGGDAKPGRYVTRRTELALYNMGADPGETNNVAALHPDVIARMETLAEQCRADLGDGRTRRTGSNLRPPGQVE